MGPDHSSPSGLPPASWSKACVATVEAWLDAQEAGSGEPARPRQEAERLRELYANVPFGDPGPSSEPPSEEPDTLHDPSSTSRTP